MIGAGLVALTGLLFSAFRAGGNKQKVKQLESEVKDNDKLKKIRRKSSRLSRADKLNRMSNYKGWMPV